MKKRPLADIGFLHRNKWGLKYIILHLSGIVLKEFTYLSTWGISISKSHHFQG